MITGLHAIIYSRQTDDVRAFFRDVLGWRSVDAGEGWLIFALPPAELAVHPAEESSHELYLMCDDLQRTIADLERKGVALARPIGSVLGLYEPRHPTALGLGAHEDGTA